MIFYGHKDATGVNLDQIQMSGLLRRQAIFASFDF
jgi:hypothetical protein